MRIRTDFRSLIKGYRRIEYYAGNFTRYFLPDTLFSARFRSEFENLDENELADIERRVSYYARLAEVLWLIPKRVCASEISTTRGMKKGNLQPISSISSSV